MKYVLRSSLLLSAACLALFSFSSAHAEGSGFYISAKGAKALTLRSSFDPLRTAANERYHFDYDNEFAYSASFGSRLSDYLRVEGELGYLSNTIDDITNNAGTIVNVTDGELGAAFAMAVILGDLPITEQLTAFAGGGVGIAKPEMTKWTRSGGSLELEDQIVFAWKLTAGLSYELYENMHLFSDYTYFQTSEFDVKLTQTGLGGTTRENTSSNLQSHMIGVGLRYDF